MEAELVQAQEQYLKATDALLDQWTKKWDSSELCEAHRRQLIAAVAQASFKVRRLQHIYQKTLEFASTTSRFFYNEPIKNKLRRYETSVEEIRGAFNHHTLCH